MNRALGRIACRLLLLSGCWTGLACADRGPLVDLDAAGLAPGPLAGWPNRGSAGGQFAVPADAAQPTVVDVDGRRAVRFGGPCLASSFPAPAGLTGNHEFSLVLLARAEKLAGKQVVVSWASRPWDSAEFGYGTGTEGAYCSYGSGNFGFGRLTPPEQAWHHLAFVYAPGRFAVYADGELLVERKMTLKTKPNEPIRLGTAWDHLKKQPCFPFPGELAAVRIYDRALSVREVRNQAGRFEPFAPQPADGSTVEARQATLIWQPGDERAGRFDLYLGEQADEVAATDRSSKLRRTPLGVDKPSFGPMELVLGKTYAWRVDQLDARGQVAQKGKVWTFTVSAGPAGRPQPRDRVAGVGADLRELRWAPGKYAVAQTVYFGTDANSVARGEGVLARDLPAATAEVPLPGALDYARTYYWRVDQHNGTLPPARGEVWAFRTADEPRKDDVTFFVGSDCHYGREEINELNARTIDRMNWLAGEPMPKQVGGETVRTPRGVVLCGDLLDNGSDKQTAPAALERLVRDIGLSGEGRLAFPAYEGFGNHDGGPGSFVRQAISERNRRRPGLAAVSANGLHYSWDWDHVHLVQLNLFAGAGPEDVASVTAKPHDPENALDFLREDLARRVGASGRPVVIFQHFGLPPDGMSHWWQESAKDRFRELVRPYQVVAVFHGHSHAATIYQWKGLRIIADGSTQRPESDGGDFFVIRITKDEFIAARRLSDRWGDCVREALRPAPRQSPAKALGGPQPADRMENTNFTNQNEFHQCVR